MNIYSGLKKMALVAACVALFSATQAHAHFVWVYSEGGNVKVVFGEGLEPDQAQFLNGISGMKAYSMIEGKLQPVEFAKQVDGDEGWYEAEDELGPHVEIACPYGVFGRGDKTMFLDYSAKYVTFEKGIGTEAATKPSKNLALDIVPGFVNGQLTLTAYFKGMPVKDVEVQLESVDTDSTVQTTNELGQVVLQPASRYVIRGKHSVAESGEFDGQSFSERRFYCTLVLDVHEPKKVAVSESDQPSTKTNVSTAISIEKLKTDYAEFPRGMTSFGATVLDDVIYVIGGKSGRAHSYAKSYQNREVFSLKLDGSDSEWQVAGENLGLQGLAIVGHAGKVFRIGGLEARNKEGDDHDLHSVDNFVAFDVESKTWIELPKLPQGRSSFDACIADGHVYVVGGWTMDGENESVWATNMLKYDLSKSDGKWEAVDAPFQTRALAVRSHQGKLVVIGGIQSKGGPTGAVHIYDLASGKWSKGPEVPTDSRLKAFGCSAVSLGDHLLASTYDGGIYQLNADMSAWNKVYELEAGRFFHQMLPVGKNRFSLVGGSHMEHGSHFEIEVFEVTDSRETKVSTRE